MATTWEAEVGHIFIDKWDEGLRFIVLRGPASLCAYVGVAEHHPLACVDNYDDLPVQAHGGLTYGKKGGGEKAFLPTGFMWWGWDYAHCDDATTYDYTIPQMTPRETDHKWTPEEVDRDSWSALYDFKKLLRIAERIHRLPAEKAVQVQ
jgi:hypothetical protein